MTNACSPSKLRRMSHGEVHKYTRTLAGRWITLVLCPQHRSAPAERRGIGRNPQPVAAGQHQFDAWRCCSPSPGLLSTSAKRTGAVLFPQPSPPPVEGGLLQSSLTTIGADRLAAAFLLRDSLAPQLAPLLLFGAHLSTMCRIPWLE